MVTEARRAVDLSRGQASLWAAVQERNEDKLETLHEAGIDKLGYLPNQKDIHETQLRVARANKKQAIADADKERARVSEKNKNKIFKGKKDFDKLLDWEFAKVTHSPFCS